MLREKQKKKIIQIFNCNEISSKDSSLSWKILIYDDRGSSIISSIFENFFDAPTDDSPKNIESETSYDFGITYHTLITDRKRTRIADVPAIYFILPTKENIQILINDIQTNLYDKFYINFISPINREDLREFARQVAEKSDGGSIAKITDSYCDFLSYEEGRFELFENGEDSLFKKLYERTLQLSDLQVQCDYIANKLLSIISTNSQGVPIILSKGDLAKICSDILTDKISNLLPNDNSNTNSKKSQPFGVSAISQRPILIIVDRCVDFLTMLHHCNTYDSLLDDIFGIVNGRHGLTIGGTRINKPTDTFWRDNKHYPVNVVFSKVRDLFNAYKQEYSSIDKNLTQAISNIQSIKASQDSVTAHTKLCNDVVTKVKKRRLDEFYLAEVDVFSKSGFAFVSSGIDANLIDVEDQNKNPETQDKVRLLSVAYLADTLTNSQLEDYATIYPVNFLSQVELFKTFKGGQGSQYSSEDIFSSFVGRFSTFKAKKAKDEDEKSVQDAMAILSHMPITELARKAIAGKFDSFEISDPLKNDQNEKSETSIDSRKLNVVVFVLGPGNYAEFDGMYGVGIENQGKGVEVTYGCTKMQRPNDFLSELTDIFG